MSCSDGSIICHQSSTLHAVGFSDKAAAESRPESLWRVTRGESLEVHSGALDASGSSDGFQLLAMFRAVVIFFDWQISANLINKDQLQLQNQICANLINKDQMQLQNHFVRPSVSWLII